MLADDPLKILIVEQSNDEANRIISILRSADYQVEAQLAADQQQLQQYLSKRNWDLLIAPTGTDTLPAQQIFQCKRRAERDFPVILISDTYDPGILIEGLRLGAEDVVVKDQDQHLLRVVARSLVSVNQRRQAREWERKLALAEKRSEYLMNTSRFPIAVVQEGTYVYANQACASIFGFEEPDEMLCLPVVDNIAACDRDKLKAYMVPLQSAQEIMPFEAVVKILNAKGQEDSAFLEIKQIQYNGEPSLQFTINSDKLFAANTGQAEEVAATAFSTIQPQLLYEMVSRAISKSVQTGQDSVLLNIQIDRFDSLKEDLGIARAEKIAHSLVTFVGSLFNQNFDCGRLSENCFVAVLAETSDQQGLKIAEDIVAKTCQEVFDVDEESFSLTTSIGGTLLNENVASVERALERSQQVIDQLRQDRQPGNGARFFVPDIHSDEVSQNEAVVITAKKLLGDQLFWVLYQPIVALISGGSGKEYYEAVLGVSKEVPSNDIPEDFINNLFKSEIAAEVDRWVISEVLNTLVTKLASNPDTQLFINISRQSFSDQSFLPWLTQALKKTKLPSDAVIFQFRETDALRYLNQAAAISDEIKKAGGQISITNFGVAINPLKMLERVAVDFVKIDRLIVEDLQKGGEGKVRFQTLMAGMTGTGVDVIVPFVEKASVLPILWQQGVQYIQGHYVQPPSFTMDYDFSENS
jgi:EAL domain-containing protein (putative c-di-GMP-specific phosphodiesterase class I)/CheY-like chemotaxis protein